MSSDRVVDEAAVADDTSDTVTAASSRSDIIAACRTSLDFLAALILVDVYKYGYPPLFHGLWQLICGAALEVKAKPKYALGIPRGFSKTVVLKLYVVWLILFSDRKFILVVCNTEKHAFNFIADVANMLSSSNIVRIFGNWRASMGDTDTKDTKKFSFRGRDIVLAAIGSGSSPRGLNINYLRPDIVIMDDMQNRDEAANPTVASELFDWMLGTLMKACDPHRCVFIFVGNMYPFEGSILRKLKHSPSWISFITGAILADGTSIWPEHRDIHDLLQEYQTDAEQGRQHIFFAEVMNDEESGTASGVDTSKIKKVEESLTVEHAQGGYVIIDPSGKKQTSDDTAIGAVLVFDGIPIYWEAVSRQMDPFETIKTATELAMKYGMQLICVEGVAYQSTLIFWFNKYYVENGIEGIHVGELSTGGMQKNARIWEFLKKLLSGKNMLGNDCRNAIIYEISQWNPLKRDNKDNLLDVGAYMDVPMQLWPEKVTLLVHAAVDNTFPAGADNSTLALAF